MKSEFVRIRKERMEDIGRCELCGSKRSLELHHCIPKSFGGDDSEDNLILICGSCHSKLTPRSTLTKIGIDNARAIVYASEFIEKLENEIECGLTASDVVDIFNSCIKRGK